MSGSNLDGNAEYDEQLRMQELYGDSKDGDTQTHAGGDTDAFRHPTDSPYQWDLDEKAWFPRSRRISLPRIRPIMASLMMAHLVLLQMFKMWMLGLQRNLHKKKPENPLIPERREEKERPSQDGFTFKTEIQMYMCLVCLQQKKCKDYKKKLSVQQKQLDWRPGRRAGPSWMHHERVVIIKNMLR
ncbi:hypothetical protein P7K49_014236 [Saguinus oedipus]|uniref:Uncharacterized protein n=1 Tax=Saguinus oedipus TaxID=9490 RepID=A0ABQ9VIV0_SAGOE|nr:hypothetical protein P7K49_014236 [Saguinus oedipus]